MPTLADGVRPDGFGGVDEVGGADCEGPAVLGEGEELVVLPPTAPSFAIVKMADSFSV
jgi:hypothetical protein